MIIRNIDEAGRIVLPVNYRRAIGIEAGEELEMLCEGERIIIRRRLHTCKLCDRAENVDPALKICRECINKINSLT